ncbi:MAG: alkyl hydroperoxide reductase, partial [Cohaesibacter sp.]|nr:alkyl hydroperoxide reductase [Cohaesibacter sp.]
MTIDALKAQMPDFAKDVKLNLSNISGEEGLSDQQKYGLMVACAI